MPRAASALIRSAWWSAVSGGGGGALDLGAGLKSRAPCRRAGVLGPGALELTSGQGFDLPGLQFPPILKKLFILK